MKRKILITCFALVIFLTGIFIFDFDITKALYLQEGEKTYNSNDSDSINDINLSHYISKSEQIITGINSDMTPIYFTQNYYSYNEMKIYKNVSFVESGIDTSLNGLPQIVYKEELQYFTPGKYNFNAQSNGNNSDLILYLVSNDNKIQIQLDNEYNNLITVSSASFESESSFYLIITSSNKDIINPSEILFSSLKVNINDLVSPEFSNYENEYTVKISEGITLEKILKNIVVIDNIEGRINFSIDSSNYINNKVGKYTVTIKAIDSSNNTNYLTLYINVIDDKKPVINGSTSTHYTNYDMPTSLETILSKIKAYDETDGELEINIESDNYSGNEKKLGSHIIVISAIDSSNNKTLIEIDIVVIDITPPTISGISEYTSTLSTQIKEEQIRKGLIVDDNYNDNLSIILVNDSYSSNNFTLGIYTLEYKAIDSSGNESDIFTVTVKVKDDLSPVFYVDTNYFYIDDTVLLTKEEIFNLLIKQANINLEEISTYTIETSDYTNQEGIYNIRCELVTKNNEIINLSSAIVVTDNKETTKLEEQSRFEKVLNKIKSILKNILDWIIKYLAFGWLWNK